jgi:hypothetical protein
MFPYNSIFATREKLFPAVIDLGQGSVLFLLVGHLVEQEEL